MRRSSSAFVFAVTMAVTTVSACSSSDEIPLNAAPPADAGSADDVATDTSTGDRSADDVASDDVAVPDDGSREAATSDADIGADASDAADLPHFSFFYTSLEAMRRLSGSPNGFGGDLRFGMPTGIEGADKICQTIATDVGFGAKTWRAFLSATRGPDGVPVHAIERIGNGPWYDRKGRLIAQDRAGLLSERPLGDPEAAHDLPDETGEGTSSLGSTDAITGSNMSGRLYFLEARNTCMDWTNKALEGVFIMCGHPWRVTDAAHWMQAHPERSCVPGVRTGSTGTSDGSSIGAGGGWGGFYCFALTP